MNDFDLTGTIADAMHRAANPKGNNFRVEAQAVIDTIKAKTPLGEQVREALLGYAPAPAKWDLLDQTPAASAQLIVWHAPDTVKEILELTQ